MNEEYYRYKDVRYAPYPDEYGDRVGRGRLEIVLQKFNVIKHTPKGVWIDNYGIKKFILRSANNQFALPTKEEAKKSFIARKKRQKEIYNARLQDVEEALYLVELKLWGKIIK